MVALIPEPYGVFRPRRTVGRARKYRVDFPSYMDECDANFSRLLALVPLLSRCDVCAFDVVVPDLDLRVRMTVLERCPYTSLVELVQHSRSASDTLPAPRMKIRLYHDAKAAEVVEFQHARRFAAVYPYPNAEMRQPDEKAQVNRFLGEYLSMCLTYGGALEEPLLAASD